MKAVKAAIFTVAIVGITLAAILGTLAGCIEPTPTVSPIPTPVSPIPTPEALQVQAIPVHRSAQESLTAEVVAAVVTAIISILLEVVPGLADEWNKIDSTYKRLTWLIGCLMVPVAILGAGCLGLDLGVVAPACDKQGAVEALRIGFAAYFMGQATFAVIGHAIRKQRK